MPLSNKNASSLLYHTLILSSRKFNGLHQSKEKNRREHGNINHGANINRI